MFAFLTYFRQQAMVFSSEEKTIIKNNHEKKGWTTWTTYRICKEHKSKKWVLTSVQHLLKQFKDDWFMKRRTGSSWPVTITTDENAELVEELICSQEDFPRTLKDPWKIARNVSINRSLVKRLAKRKKSISLRKWKLLIQIMEQETKEKQDQGIWLSVLTITQDKFKNLPIKMKKTLHLK